VVNLVEQKMAAFFGEDGHRIQESFMNKVLAGAGFEPAPWRIHTSSCIPLRTGGTNHATAPCIPPYAS
jgi:hypothetical protein